MFIFKMTRKSSISHTNKRGTWLRKGYAKRETDSFLIATQNDTQLWPAFFNQEWKRRNANSRCRLCGDRDETINHLVSEKYKIRSDCVGEGDLLGFLQEILIWPDERMVYAQPRICPKKWDVQNSLGFEIQMDDLISDR